ncbi:LacI family DNA-binding transcriptional regulator [Dactylosporangium siamense]|uniref:LacI family transcriptional regulator n=1 Tax=Dactylosporangium siamense TaxID=685454 RepID=A0A919PVF9_9ACTN|nr:LacI family DNA-binding transcriptional regulator [Dactylosporangium siamense]GIG50016.1 LacI family transcriptional regulator [Dactylosporangium siamense]
MPKPSARTGRVTIVDVAQHAEVSTTAVSKVVRNAYGASPEMQAKVRKAIAELGYRPHAAARGLRGQTYSIGVMLPNIRNPFFADIIDGATEVLEDAGYQVLMGPGCNGEAEEARVTETMIDHSMDGVILIAPVSSRQHLEHVARSVPTVIVGRHGRSSSYDSVADDDLSGAALVVNHLADLGHRRIAHIEHLETDPDHIVEMPNAVRADGYRQAMRARRLDEHIDVASTTYTQEGGYLGAQQLLARLHQPTAIFAGADIVAMGALEAIAEAGLTVPGDIAVAGYDNTMFAGFAPVSLTTVDQRGRQMGSTAARLVLDRIAQPRRPASHMKLAPTLIARRTTAVLPH